MSGGEVAGYAALIILGMMAVIALLGWLASFYYFDHR